MGRVPCRNSEMQNRRTKRTGSQLRTMNGIESWSHLEKPDKTKCCSTGASGETGYYLGRDALLDQGVFPSLSPCCPCLPPLPCPLLNCLQSQTNGLESLRTQSRTQDWSPKGRNQNTWLLISGGSTWTL